MWSVENPWDVVTGENILVFIMFELTLPAKTSISRPHAGFLVVVSFNWMFVLDILGFGKDISFEQNRHSFCLFLDHPRNESQFRDQWFVGLVHLC